MAVMPLLTFTFGLTLGTTIVFASSHWILAWVGLEINTLAVIPLMMLQNHPRATEATTKYFVAQATASSLILLAVLNNAWYLGLWDIPHLLHPLSVTIASFALSLKLGLAPLHMWVPEVLQGIDLIPGMIILAWQKLAPFILLLQLPKTSSATLMAFALASLIVGGWGGLSQPHIRKLLAYSSIAHLGWMVAVLQFSHTLAILTLATYVTLTIASFLMLKLNKSTTIIMLARTSPKIPTMALFTCLLFLSLAGLPPLTGFGPKLLILSELVAQGFTFLAFLIAITSLLTLYFYMRVAYYVALLKIPNSTNGMALWHFILSHHTLPLAVSMMISLFALPILPAITAILTN